VERKKFIVPESRTAREVHPEDSFHFARERDAFIRHADVERANERVHIAFIRQHADGICGIPKEFLFSANTEDVLTVVHDVFHLHHTRSPFRKLSATKSG
jgi:hypothetical protein